MVGGRIRYVDRPGYEAPRVEDVAAAKEKKPRTKRVAGKIDKKYLAGARELRDRYLERFNSDPTALPSSGKYEVCRALPSPVLLLPF